jgi:hypothetical protein
MGRRRPAGEPETRQLLGEDGFGPPLDRLCLSTRIMQLGRLKLERFSRSCPR